MDLFETMHKRVGCQYISDMKSFPYNKIARSVIKGLGLNQFTLNELSDAARYICYEDVAFESHAAAREFFDRH